MKDKYAFPSLSNTGPRPGMELRDWFAGMALSGLLANPKNDEMDNDDLVTICYSTADDMMEMRDQEWAK